MKNLKDDVLKYLLTQKVGKSDKAMAQAVCGFFNDATKDLDTAPLNMTEIGHCINLLHHVPMIRSELSVIGNISAEWSVIIEHWSVIEELFLNEAGLNWSKRASSPTCYRYIKSLLK